MKIVVTGSGGLLGRLVVSEFVSRGYEVLGLDRSPSVDGHRPTWVVDLLDASSISQALAGANAVVHLAAWSAPGLTSDTRTFNENVSVTYNVLKAAADAAVGKVVLASSIGAYGFLYARARLVPQYLPLDEEHPAMPTDPYGLSKLVGERLADSFAAMGGMAITSLRLPGINFDPAFARIFRLMEDPGFRAKGFWTYVDARDAARACRLAVELGQNGHNVLNIAAPNSNMRQPTSELIGQYWPDVRVIGGSSANWSGLDSARARAVLGFEAEFTWDKVAPPASGNSGREEAS